MREFTLAASVAAATQVVLADVVENGLSFGLGLLLLLLADQLLLLHLLVVLFSPLGPLTLLLVLLLLLLFLVLSLLLIESFLNDFLSF